MLPRRLIGTQVDVMMCYTEVFLFQHGILLFEHIRFQTELLGLSGATHRLQYIHFYQRVFVS